MYGESKKGGCCQDSKATKSSCCQDKKENTSKGGCCGGHGH
jgi:hypothetical protein